VNLNLMLAHDRATASLPDFGRDARGTADRSY
jgi:hypothetical protein